MINHILLIFSSIIIYEFIRYIKLKDVIRSNLSIYKKILKLFEYKKVSDFRKEIVIIISVFAFVILIDLLSNSYLNFVMSVLGIIEISLIFLIYHSIRKKFYAEL